MKNLSDKQLENDLSIFSNMKEVSAPDFFYTRLIAKMERHNMSNHMESYIKPVWIICSLILLLIANTTLLRTDSNSANIDADYNIESLASSYDQTISN